MNAGRDVVAVFFVASPLHYLAARRVALDHEANSRRVIVPYRPDARRFIDASDWDAVAYAPWPRFDPLPGAFGRLRRLKQNIATVAAAVGPCAEIRLHSPVFDTEAVNYYLRALPRRCGAGTMHARILPDGLMNIARHPLGPVREAAQWLRKLRRLAAPELDYWCFRGDRTAAEAPFVDRIYTLAGFPHDYPRGRTVELAPLMQRRSDDSGSSAIVIGQPLQALGVMSQADHDATRDEIARWCLERGIDDIVYKGHPRDGRDEFRPAGARKIELDVPLEVHLSQTPYRAVLGVNSTALFLARQICAPSTAVVSFGTDRIRTQVPQQHQASREMMDRLGIERR
ncbi:MULTISPECIES: polysialyltransferase family glycosyltransferase [unclassified Rubrivivax]|uniref:polysialyltransferase family glycosyltransferase n=1 Tax=unclassified Rubrivivax TaxID=2649762 RepID=UPI0013E93D35|nr:MULTISPECIES: polysialyltransferase family glycosyltransferase [unclassified Rubrivivax]MCC9595866.1 alpha-2,8-polysialyltransferase family protein [Rubrivivax sp. JA1055]MCC9647794.1 alpha-2,8-polysialyltransferase family protein [Rubrivivax sp. JA1029]MCD0418127.1 alpha-2,8-polysialyltransferase family protein [Rubrivivax sp. JA1024]